MKSYRIFAGATAGLSALILLLTQVAGGQEKAAAPEIEPLPSPTVAPSILTPQPSLPPPSPTPTEEPPPGEVGTVIYEHDFTSPEGGLLSGQSFETASNQFGSRLAEYTPNGTLLVTSTSSIDTFVAGANTQDLVVNGRDLSDIAEVSVEADATPDDIGDAASWGLACRRDREVGRFYYAFVAELAGQTGAGIIRQDESGGEWTELDFVSNPEGIDIGRGITNRLRLDCLGSTLTLYVDGQEAAQARDSTYSSGSVALVVNPIPSSGEASAEVAFDNMVIREA